MKNSSGTLLRRTALLIAFIAATWQFAGCSKDYSAEDIPQTPVVKDHNLEIHFSAVSDTLPLSFDTATYTNHFDEPYTVHAFKFYLYGIQLINTDSNRVFEISNDKYYLVDFSDSASTVIKLGVLPYQYNRIAFMLGVDSGRSAGTQTGALDPANGMFWNSTDGYIMALLEGTSPLAATSGNKFEYHVGGFHEPDNTLRKITLLFPFAQTVDLKPEKSTALTITADASAWFYNPHDIKIKQQPVSNTPGPLARQIAENYSKMFTVVQIINE